MQFSVLQSLIHDPYQAFEGSFESVSKVRV